MTDLPDGVTVFGDTPPTASSYGPDPDLSPEDGAGSGLSPLDNLRRIVNTKVDKGSKLIEVPTRPGVTLDVDLNVDMARYGDWQHRSRRPRPREDDVDPVKLACYVIGNMTRDILVDGDPTGMRFSSVELRPIVNLADRASMLDTVKAFFGDGGVAVVGAWETWVLAAGIDRDRFESDPEPDPT